jgi:NAD-dependent deacetylase
MSIHGIRDALRGAKLAVALTGAGVSVESGIPDFRSAGGLWERYPPEEHGTIEAFHAEPERFWRFYRELLRVVGDARPNPGHLALARLERLGVLAAVITQNVDGLHQAAGSSEVIELHGGPDALVCLACGARRRERLAALTAAPRCACGATLKPDVVLFGEELPRAALARAQELASRCDVMLVVGTSAMVHPAATLPRRAFEAGATLCELNLEPTDLSLTGTVRWFAQGKAGTTLPRLADLVERDLAGSRA